MGRMSSPVCSQIARKYYPSAPKDKRCFEWFFPKTNRRLHLSLHDAKEEEDLWTYLRQLSGAEDIAAAREWTQAVASIREPSAFGKEETAMLAGTLLRYSEKARSSGLLRTTT